MIKNIADVLARLSAISVLQKRIAYDHFSTAPKLPFLTYSFEQFSDGADNYHNLLSTNVSLELYQESRDFELEKRIIKAFSDVEVTTDCEYIEKENLYETIFYFSFYEKI